MSTSHAIENEVTVFARIFGNGDEQIPAEFARQILDLQVSKRDEARMQDLVVRNQNDGLSPAEKEEMIAFAKATSLLGILKSKARRTLGVKLEIRTVS
jgi:Fic family protein